MLFKPPLRQAAETICAIKEHAQIRLKFNYMGQKIYFLLITLALLTLGCAKKVPNADFEIQTPFVASPTEVTFTNKSSNATSYSWDFGDSSSLSNEVNPNHSYKKSGSFNVSLTAFNNEGSHTVKKSINILNPTSLTIIAKDEKNQTIKNAVIHIFDNESGFKTGIGISGSSFSNNGTITFTNLLPKTYYWWVEGECDNNIEKGLNNGELLANQNNVFEVRTSPLASFSFTNNSTDNYKLEINGKVEIPFFDKNSTKTIYYRSGSHSIKVTQLDGFIGSPIIKDYTKSIYCVKAPTTLTFP